MSRALSPEKTEQQAILAQLWDEFARLNTVHFNNTLTLREIKLSTRKQYGGYYRPSESLIVLSWQAYKEHGWDETLETFRHEVAHIVHPNHSKAFWTLAFSLGCTRRYASPPQNRDHAYTRYVYECPVCSARLFRRKRLVRASCGKCDRSYNPKFAFRLVSSPALRK